MARIYTKTGDGGMTSLADGGRVQKSCARLEAYGTVDELSSELGLLLVHLKDEDARELVLVVQEVLFCMGAQLATGSEEKLEQMPQVKPEDVEELEKAVDKWQRELPPWRGFVLPGGVESAARAHVCRTVCRRAERRVLALMEEAPVAGEVLRYLNRLSDFLFVLALYENFLAGKEEILWQKSR